ECHAEVAQLAQNTRRDVEARLHAARSEEGQRGAGDLEPGCSEVPRDGCREARHGEIATRSGPSEVRLKLTEIFHSLQGEADTAGIPTVFVRLTGCPLRCQYCDTAYAFHGGEWWELDAILTRVAELGAKYVCVTGGEPLAQKNCLPLLQQLCDAGYRVSLETSGAMSLEDVDPRVVRVVDVKTPASGEESR